MAAKRTATSDLNHENWNDEEEAEEAGNFVPAPQEVLQERRIIKPRRRFPPNSSQVVAPSSSTTATVTPGPPNSTNPFSGFSAFSTAFHSGAGTAVAAAEAAAPSNANPFSKFSFAPVEPQSEISSTAGTTNGGGGGGSGRAPAIEESSEEGYDSDDPGHFQPVSPEVLRTRKIIRARRSLTNEANNQQAAPPPVTTTTTAAAAAAVASTNQNNANPNPFATFSFGNHPGEAEAAGDSNPSSSWNEDRNVAAAEDGGCDDNDIASPDEGAGEAEADPSSYSFATGRPFTAAGGENEVSESTNGTHGSGTGRTNNLDDNEVEQEGCESGATTTTESNSCCEPDSTYKAYCGDESNSNSESVSQSRPPEGEGN